MTDSHVTGQSVCIDVHSVANENVTGLLEWDVSEIETLLNGQDQTSHPATKNVGAI